MTARSEDAREYTVYDKARTRVSWARSQERRAMLFADAGLIEMARREHEWAMEDWVEAVVVTLRALMVAS